MNEASRAKASALIDPRDARDDFLRKLPGADFSPSEESVAALHLIAGAVPPTSDEAKESLAQFEQADVEAFKAVFWLLDPAERLQRWLRLMEGWQHPQTKQLLLLLEPALDIVMQPLGGLHADELAVLAGELFLLPPRARGVKRAEWLAEHGADPDFKKAAIELRHANNAVVVLDPVLFAQIERPHAKFSVQAISEQEARKLALWEGSRVKRVTAEAAKSQRTVSDKVGDAFVEMIISMLVGGVVIGACIGVWAFFRGGCSPSPRSYHESQNESKPFVPRVTFTTRQIEEFIAHDPNGGTAPPAGYVTWRLQGGLEVYNAEKAYRDRKP